MKPTAAATAKATTKSFNQATYARATSSYSMRSYRPLPLRLWRPAPSSLNPWPAPATPFVVLATQRTGSNMLCGYLNGVRGIAMHNELFNEKGVFTHVGNRNLPTTSMHERDASPGEFLIQALSIDPLCQVQALQLSL